MADADRVMIAGGGVGGLSAALALKRAGVPTVVFERAPALGELGTGIQVWLNGMLALRELGVSDTVRELGAPIETQDFRSWRGRTLVSLPVEQLASRHGAPTAVVIRRPDLLKALSGALGEEYVEGDSHVVGFEQDGDGVTARFADGREVRGAALIGADGITSTVRGFINPDSAPRYAGYQYLRALTQGGGDELPANTMSISFGRGDRFGVGDVGDGWRYFFGVIVTPRGTEDSAAGRKADLLARFGGFHPPIPRVIEETDEASIMRIDIHDIEPLPRWTDGRVTLLGDAAHATTPNGGRGAGESLEDGAALGRAMAAAGDLSAPGAIAGALSAYERRRREPSTKVQRSAWQIGKLLSMRNPLAVAMREQMMRRVIGRRMLSDIESEYAAALGGDAA
jgi:2-polyprenyl-6-methoxyphenol hydroxylase-like FAD-dependent oxidoreductase